MTIDDVMQWLKSLGVPEGVGGWTMARLDASNERRLGVYQRPSYDGMQVPFDGSTLTVTKLVEVLVHWTRNAHETELAAQALYDAVRAARRPTIGGERVAYVDLRMPEPADLGADDNGIFERMLWLDIYYQPEQ